MRSIDYLLVFGICTLSVLIWFTGPARSFQTANADEVQIMPRGGRVSWDGSRPSAGSPVKLRLRGEALSMCLSHGSNWRLTVGDQPIYAQLDLPETGLSSAVRQDLPISSASSPASQDCWIIVDRATDRSRLDHLELTLNSTDLMSKAQLEISRDGAEYSAHGPAQLVYQRISAGQVIALSTLSFPATDAQFLKVTLDGATSGAIASLSGWLEEKESAELYEVPAAFGSMQGPDAAGQYLWPVILEENCVPLSSLTLHTKPSDLPLAISIVRIDNQLRLVKRVQTGVIATALESAGLTLTHNTFLLPLDAAEILTVENSELAWAVAVQGETRDGPLQLVRIEALAAEVWLQFVMPEAEELQIWFDHPEYTAALPGAGLEFPAEKFLSSGEIDQLTLEYSTPIDPAKATPLSHLNRHHWVKPAAYLLATCLALIVGVLLLRKRSF